MSGGVRIELDSARRLREFNKPHYRLAHWPIWIFVFFLAPGPLVFQLFAYGFHGWMGWWLAAVLAGTGVAGLAGRLPGVEPRPYIIRFTEDKPNPLYRRVYACGCRRTRSRVPRPLFSTVVRCPYCSGTDLRPRSERDMIDRMLRNPFRLVHLLLGGELYHCEFCRIQFHDVRRRKQDAPQHPVEAAGLHR